MSLERLHIIPSTVQKFPFLWPIDDIPGRRAVVLAIAVLSSVVASIHIYGWLVIWKVSLYNVDTSIFRPRLALTFCVFELASQWNVYNMRIYKHFSVFADIFQLATRLLQIITLLTQSVSYGSPDT